MNSPTIPLLLADGDIPTTRILAQALGAGFGDVEIRTSEQLFGANVDRRGVVISRLCHPRFGWLPHHLRERGCRYLYFLDDNFWELTPDVDVHLAPFYQNPAVVATLDAFVRRAHATLVMSRRLGDYIAVRHPHARIEYIVPGFDAFGGHARAESVATAPKREGEIRVGYPTSRRPNVAPLLVPVIAELARRHAGRLSFEFVGWAPDAVIGLPGVHLHPHIADYSRYLAFMNSRQWDIGIAPLVGAPFEAFKTQVKYREYGGCGIAGAYSRVAPYTDYVVDGATGLLVDNTSDAWIRALERLIGDTDLRATIARNALADVKAHFDERATATQLKALLVEAAEAEGASAPAALQAASVGARQEAAS